ncbi:CAMK family protein kinase [Tritrichomonas foetus]|uniref:CAMK family protein kinase n=1 Tax=Tritrichomonas foetus TaxID=1144522 RepID=A0A1J4K0J9_9EUKA|nr:CAMK family protein kinase [Tritrichomonas foetus]|eukprot:OHT04961.1 CAMK family protein kinase [Tritrichomonas foetus]
MSSEELQVIEPLQIGPYVIRGTVGEGAFSVVKLVCHAETHLYYACKIVPKTRINTPSLQERFELEIRINQQLHHPGVVAIYDLLRDENNYYVIMEFCPNGELFQYIVDREHLSEQEARPFVRQVLETLKYIHDNGISHRDLKPENLLLDSMGKVKLSDFGLSRYIPANGLVDTPCGSPCYASPECISGNSYNGRTTDVWSIGVIIYAMLTGQLPWTKRNQAQLFAQIKRGEYSIPNFLSETCQSFVRGLMTVNVNDRLTIEQALDHPWLSGVPNQYDAHEVTYQRVSLKLVDRVFCYDVDEEDLQNLGIERKNTTENLTFTKTLKMCKRGAVRHHTHGAHSHDHQSNHANPHSTAANSHSTAANSHSTATNSNTLVNVNTNSHTNVISNSNHSPNQITKKKSPTISTDYTNPKQKIPVNPVMQNRPKQMIHTTYAQRGSQGPRPKSILQARPVIQKPVINK